MATIVTPAAVVAAVVISAAITESEANAYARICVARSVSVWINRGINGRGRGVVTGIRIYRSRRHVDTRGHSDANTETNCRASGRGRNHGHDRQERQYRDSNFL